jgi:hypothetical protein
MKVFSPLLFAAAFGILRLPRSLGDVDVQVGTPNGTNGSDFFSPETIIVAGGEKVLFHFHENKHSVVQAGKGLEGPCERNGGAFDTGILNGSFFPFSKSGFFAFFLFPFGDVLTSIFF